MDLLVCWPRLNKCCCCLSLRTGCLVVGYVSLIISVLAFAGVSFSLYKVIEYTRAHGDKPDAAGHSPQDIQKMALSLYISHAYFLLVLLYYMVISLLMIIGVHKNKTRYLRFYCNATLLLLVLASALVVVTLVFFGIMASVPLLKWCVILFYGLVVVRSACLEMEESNRPPIYELKNVRNSESLQAAPLI